MGINRMRMYLLIKSPIMKTRDHAYMCPVEAAFDCIGGRWKALIIWYIGGSCVRYSDIKAHLPRVTPHMLSVQLKALEEDRLIIRTQYEEIPPRVEYRLTQTGIDLLPILDALCDWAALQYPERIPADFVKKSPGMPERTGEQLCGSADTCDRSCHSGAPGEPGTSP